MPPGFDGLIDIQHVPGPLLIIHTQTKCGNGPDTSTQQQHTLLQLSIKDRVFVLVIIITVCKKPQVCQIHKQKIFRAACQT